MTQRVVDVERLTPGEQLDLIGELWDRLARAPENVPLTEAQREEIDRRSDELDQDVRAGRPSAFPGMRSFARSELVFEGSAVPREFLDAAEDAAKRVMATPNGYALVYRVTDEQASS